MLHIFHRLTISLCKWVLAYLVIEADLHGFPNLGVHKIVVRADDQLSGGTQFAYCEVGASLHLLANLKTVNEQNLFESGFFKLV